MPVRSLKAPKADPEAAYAAALRLLARREHSRLELHRKLEQRGFPASMVSAAVERVQHDGYLSDARFALSLARHRADQGYGELRIRAELTQHGIESAAVEQVLAGFDVDWVERALRQARRHFAVPPEAGAESARILRHLTQRGFPSSVARTALRNWAKSVQEPG